MASWHLDCRRAGHRARRWGDDDQMALCGDGGDSVALHDSREACRGHWRIVESPPSLTYIFAVAGSYRTAPPIQQYLMHSWCNERSPPRVHRTHGPAPHSGPPHVEAQVMRVTCRPPRCVMCELLTRPRRRSSCERCAAFCLACMYCSSHFAPQILSLSVRSGSLWAGSSL